MLGLGLEPCRGLPPLYSSPIFARYWHSENVSPPTSVIVPSLSMRVFDFWLASAPTATGTSLALIICRLGVGLGLRVRGRVKGQG